MADAFSKPEVSIVIPFFNREQFLGEAIESVLGQSFTDWELLLIDDGSTDGSRKIANRYLKKLPHKIHLLSHENHINKGAAAARNLGIKKAAGNFITFLDSDDIYFPQTLEKQISAFAENSSADAVCGTLECWYSWSEEAKKTEKDFVIDLILATDELYQPPDLLIHNLNAGGRKPGINCIMLKTDFVRRTGVFEEEFTRTGEDQVFWAKVSLSGKIFVINEVLAKYRQHPESTCAVETSEGADIDQMTDFLDWLENYLQEQNISDARVRKALKKFRRNVRFEKKLKFLKQIYRRTLPLHLRYKIRGNWTKLKKKLG